MTTLQIMVLVKSTRPYASDCFGATWVEYVSVSWSVFNLVALFLAKCVFGKSLPECAWVLWSTTSSNQDRVL